MLDKVKLGKYHIEPHVPVLAQDLIARMLQVNPTERITIPQIVQHPWWKQMSSSDEILPDYCTVESAELLEFDPEIGYGEQE